MKPWITAIILTLVLLLGLGAAELLAQAVSPLSETMIGESWCIRADGGPCP